MAGRLGGAVGSMTLAVLIALAWIATVVFTIGLANRRGVPILHAFAPIRTYRGLYFSLAALATTRTFYASPPAFNGLTHAYSHSLEYEKHLLHLI
jgi:hypothetical protein